MHLTDEIHFRFLPDFDGKTSISIRPAAMAARRWQAWRVSDRLRFKGGFAYTRAVFREGLFAGNDVPLVSHLDRQRRRVLGHLPQWLMFDGVVRYVGEPADGQRPDQCPAADPGVLYGGRRPAGRRDRPVLLVVRGAELFDTSYFDYAVASPFPFGFDSAIGSLQCLPAAGPRVPAQSRSDLPVGGGGRPATQPAAVRSKDRDG